jgi:hypothetical protein
MTKIPFSMAFLASFRRVRALQWASVATTLAAVVTMSDGADAARRIAGPYDGVWTTVFATTRGNCSSGYSVPFTVAGSRVLSAGGGRVAGSIGRRGSVAVSVSVGASHASGGGRHAGNYGAGHWSGIITGDRCSGTWQATRG